MLTFVSGRPFRVLIMVNDPQQSAQATVVVVVVVVMTVEVVVVGHEAGCGLQMMFRVPFCVRLSVVFTSSLRCTLPAFFPFFLRLTRAVKAPHAELVPLGLLSVPVMVFDCASFSFLIV